MPGLSTAQRASIPESTGAVNGWEGSIRSGKTIASRIRWAEFTTAAPDGHLALLVWTLTTIQRNVLDLLANLHPSIVQHPRGNNVAHIMGREVQLVGFSDKRSEAVIRGLTLAGAYVDEATLMPEQTFVQLLGRLSIDGSKLFFTTNPDSQSHWLRRRYLARLKALPDWRIFHITMDDNPSLSPAYVEAKKREFTGLWYRRFILGEWVYAEGAIYDTWDPDVHVIPWEELPPMRRLLGVGLDYGTTNPTSAVLLGLGEDGRLYAVDEWRHDPAISQHRLTDAQLSQQLRDWLALDHLPYPSDLQPEWLFVDPAAASLKVQLHQAAMLRRNYKPVNRARYKSSDRTYQGKTWARKAGRPSTASPGYSNHGTGSAIDLHPAGIQTWVQANGRAYGWTWTEGRKLGEPWHFVYSSSLDRYKGQGPPDVVEVQKKLGVTRTGSSGPARARR